jgi:hypothetical protein
MVRRSIPLSLLAVSMVACGSSPSGPTTATSIATTVLSTSTTSVAPVTGLRYIGTFTQVAPLPSLPLDLSLFFNLPGGALRPGAIQPRAIYQVNGGYNTGSGGFTGSVTGTLDGTLQSGNFTGVMTANLANGCVARRNYSGPLTTQALNWTPGAQLETCSGASPLTTQVNPPAAPPSSPPTTSIAATTTTIPTSTTSTTTTAPSTISSTTSSSTSTSSSTTTVPPLTASYSLQGGECVFSSPTNGSCTFIGSASGGLPPYTYRWIFINANATSQFSLTGQQVNPTFGCSFSNAQSFQATVNFTVTSSTGAQVTVTGSHRVDRSFTIVCTSSTP